MADDTLKVCRHCGKQFPRSGSNRTQFCSTHCRFWHKVQKAGPDDCWIWLGTKPSFGHGQFVCEKVVYAHRFAWEEANGPIPDGMCALHRCDNPACVNPAHVFIGTREDNMHDMWAKGRGSKPPRRIGSKHHMAKLTEGDVRAIRASTEPPLELAKRYGVAHTVIYAVRNRRTWTHVS